jgi:copper chaperone CopZ
MKGNTMSEARVWTVVARASSVAKRTTTAVVLRDHFGAVVVGLALAIAACAEKKTEPVVKPGPNLASIDIAIAGMHCDGCAMTITDALKEVDGVVECQVSFQEKKASVKYDPARVAPAQLAAVIEKTGYRPTLPGAPANVLPPQ